MEDVFNDIMKSPLALKKTIHVFFPEKQIIISLFVLTVFI